MQAQEKQFLNNKSVYINKKNIPDVIQNLTKKLTLETPQVVKKTLENSLSGYFRKEFKQSDIKESYDIIKYSEIKMNQLDG